MKILRLLPLLTCVLLACTTDSYKTGEGKYSKMLTDFAELSVNGDKQGVSFVTDDGASYTFTKPYEGQWIETADTVYRILVYYNKVEENKAELVQMGNLRTLIPCQPDEIENPRQDPAGLEAVWVANNGKYINIGLLLKNGRDEQGEEGRHKLAIVCDEVRQNPDQTRTACYRLLHDQEDTPQYYTNRHYFSILLPEERPDSVLLTMITYDGTIEKRLAIPQ